MNRIDRVAARGRPLLIAYLPIGDPAIPDDLAERYVAAGVDVLECGVAVREPVLDGPVIRASMARALAAGADASAILGELRRALPGTPIAVMTYPEHDLATLQALTAHADGLLLPCSARGLGPIADGLATTTHLLHFLGADCDQADETAARAARGYVMVQASAGLTGSREGRLPDLAERLRRLRETGVRSLLAAGFGIHDASQVNAAIADGADGVVVGSALVEAALRGGGAVDELAAELAEAAHA